jgi:hypothetical protein
MKTWFDLSLQKVENVVLVVNAKGVNFTTCFNNFNHYNFYNLF